MNPGAYDPEGTRVEPAEIVGPVASAAAAAVRERVFDAIGRREVGKLGPPIRATGRAEGRVGVLPRGRRTVFAMVDCEGVATRRRATGCWRYPKWR